MHVYAAPTSPGASSPGVSRTQSVLRFSLVATLAYVVITFIAGLRAHSLALLSESGHNVSDFLALLLSFVAVYFQTRPATHSKTFGYQRAGVLAAFINAATLIVIAIWIAIEAIHRLSAPVAVQPQLMMVVAAAGVSDERRDRRAPVGSGSRREHAQCLPPHGRRHALNRRSDRRRRRHPSAPGAIGSTRSCPC